MIIRPGTPKDAAGIARAHTRSWRWAYRGILPEPHLTGPSQESREREWRARLVKPTAELSIVRVAEVEESGIVGLAEGGLEREGVEGFDAELNALYVSPEWQRRGVGRALMISFAQELTERGFTNMLVWVLAKNRARDFYQAMGGVEVAREVELVGMTVHEKVAYGWKRLDDLIVHRE